MGSYDESDYEYLKSEMDDLRHMMSNLEDDNNRLVDTLEEVRSELDKRNDLISNLQSIIIDLMEENSVLFKTHGEFMESKNETIIRTLSEDSR